MGQKELKLKLIELQIMKLDIQHHYINLGI